MPARWVLMASCHSLHVILYMDSACFQVEVHNSSVCCNLLLMPSILFLIHLQHTSKWNGSSTLVHWWPWCCQDCAGRLQGRSFACIKINNVLLSMVKQMWKDSQKESLVTRTNNRLTTCVGLLILMTGGINLDKSYWFRWVSELSYWSSCFLM